MNDIVAWVALVLLSIVFGTFHYKAGYFADINKENKYFKFLELWRHIINYFITGVIVYYFISVRWPDISKGNNIAGADFVLGAIFLAGIFGWLPYLIKNITVGIEEKILKKIFGK